MSGLTDAARGVLDSALAVYGPDDPVPHGILRDARRRLDEPLRVALAGTLKAGKSTLLNALIGDRVAATDAGECTRLVTWYRDGPVPAAHLEDQAGGRRALPVTRGPDGAGGLLVDPAQAADAAQLIIDWPSAGLAETTLVDTPGLDSLREPLSARTRAFVTPDDRPSGADVVVYLMRHAHRSDVDFLEAFGDLGAGAPGALGGVGAAGTVVVLSRADEIGSGRLDAVMAAGQVARSLRTDSPLRPLCQTVVAVAGLLAETASTLRAEEVAALRALAAAPRGEVDAMLLSVDRFAAAELPAAVTEALAADTSGVTLGPEDRRALLARFGIFGVRMATTALRRAARSTAVDAGDPAWLAAELARRSGLDELRETLRSRVTGRREVHQARSALVAVDLVLRRSPRPGDPRAATVAAELERLHSGAHAFVEQRVLVALRTGAVSLGADDLGAEAERLLGGDGPTPAARLALDGPADPDDRSWHAAAIGALERWRIRAESPMTSRAAAEVARAVVRSVEGLLTDAARPAGRR